LDVSNPLTTRAGIKNYVLQHKKRDKKFGKGNAFRERRAVRRKNKKKTSENLEGKIKKHYLCTTFASQKRKAKQDP